MKIFISDNQNCRVFLGNKSWKLQLFRKRTYTIELSDFLNIIPFESRSL